jgi:CRP/FNR family transcriptional regulator, cyclic AMP receptor protein
MSSGFAASFFNYGTVELHEHSSELQLLAGRPRSDWDKLFAHTETRRFSQGETIIAAGERDRSVYVLTKGILGVRLAGHPENTFKEIDAPSVVGEVAFLDGGPRSATLFGISDGELLRLRLESFEILAAREPELARAVLFDLGRLVAARLRLASDLIASTGG